MILILQGMLISFLAGIAILALLGSFGLFNLYVRAVGGASRRTHLTVWATSVAVFAAFVLFMPRYICVDQGGDRLILSYTSCAREVAPPQSGETRR